MARGSKAQEGKEYSHGLYTSSLNSGGRRERGKIHFQVATDILDGPPTTTSSPLPVRRPAPRSGSSLMFFRELKLHFLSPVRFHKRRVQRRISHVSFAFSPRSIEIIHANVSPFLCATPFGFYFEKDVSKFLKSI